jgi:molecular chaperone DnaJ
VSAKRDYYEVLSVERTADGAEIKRSYRKLALKWHPDKNPGVPEAEERFKEAAEAFEVLSDPEKRKLYDQFGHDGPRRAGFSGFDRTDEVFAHFGDLFGDMFANLGFSRRPGGAARGADTKVDLELTLADVIDGGERELEVPRRERCEPCGGSGAAPGTQPIACTNCRGSGQVIHRQGYFTLQATCPVCRGEGKIIPKPCTSCSGAGVVIKKHRLSVQIPAGVDDGQTLRVGGRGQPGARGGPPGDLYVVLHVAPDERFERDEFDVHTRVTVSMLQAALGTTVRVPTLDDAFPREEPDAGADGEDLPPAGVELTVPPGTQPGAVIVRKGQGIPVLGRRGRGDQHIHIQVTIPTQLDPEHERVLRAIAEERGEGVHKPREGFLERVFGRKRSS